MMSLSCTTSVYEESMPVALNSEQNLLNFAAHYSFPYVKKRICVVKQRVHELSPIEVALDEMQMRVTELEEVVFMKPTDAKKLQLRLQVGAEINTHRSWFLEFSYPIVRTFYGTSNSNVCRERVHVFSVFCKLEWAMPCIGLTPIFSLKV